MGGEDRDSRGANVRDGSAHQLQHEIEVVDHQVENHGHVGAARLKGSEAVDLQEAGLVEVGRGGAHGPVKPLHVAHLEHHTVLGRAPHQVFRARERVRQGLFHEQADAPLQHGAPHLGVRGRGNGHGHRIHAIEQRGEGGVRHRAELLRHLGGARRVLVVDPGKAHARHARQQPGVVEPERSGADHPDPDRRRAHTSTPRCDPSMNLRKFSTSGICGSSVRALAMPWLTVMSELNSRR